MRGLGGEQNWEERCATLKESIKKLNKKKGRKEGNKEGRKKKRKEEGRTEGWKPLYVEKPCPWDGLVWHKDKEMPLLLNYSTAGYYTWGSHTSL